MSTTRRKRRNGRFLMGVAALLPAGAAGIAAAAGDSERIAGIWTVAELDARGGAQIVEVIDYDFGSSSRHGIFRDIPDLDPLAEIEVSSEDAPDDLDITTFGSDTRLKIGDPGRTIWGRHRYRLAYPLDTVTVGDQVAWNGVGHDFEVPIEHAEVHIVAAFELTDPTCFRGALWEDTTCDVTEVEAGHVVVEADDFSSNEGLTIYATVGPRLGDRPALPAEPEGSVDDPGIGILRAALLGLAGSVVMAPLVWWVLRRRGREQVWRGGAADAAFGAGRLDPSSGMAGFDLVDHQDLDDLATIEFESPRGLSAVAGGIVHAESVTGAHQMAWLMECAIREEVVLDDSSGTLVLRRGPAAPAPDAVAELARIFNGRDSVALGKYDKEFSKAWQSVKSRLEDWRRQSDLWDPEGGRRRTTVLVLGLVIALVGLGGVVLSAVFANRSGGAWVVALIAGAVVCGVGLAMTIRSWELFVRTPEGSARFLQVESFRRFIAGSEAKHAEAAARMGLLRQYTAWAVALGELDHWSKAVQAAAAVPNSAVNTTGFNSLAYVAVASSLSSAVTKASVAPSSSSSGGGGGFSGGGGGGGGGGSW